MSLRKNHEMKGTRFKAQLYMEFLLNEYIN